MDQKLKARLDKLSPEQRQLVLKKLRQQQLSGADNNVGSVSKIIEKADRSKVIPLSYAQQRLWLLHQIDGHSPQYNEFSAQNITGSFNLEALKVAIYGLLERHEILRTCFPSLDGVPYQQIGLADQLFFQSIDFSGTQNSATDFDQKLNQLSQLAEKESLFAFELERGPLVRIHSYKMSHEQTILFINMHHIICDGWSTAVFVEELLSVYQAAVDKRNVELKPLRIQYADFAMWERQHLKTDALDKGLDYWKKHLHGAPSLLKLPMDKARPITQRHQGGSLPFVINKGTSAKLHQLCSSSTSTPFMVLLSVYSLLLTRYSGQQDVVIGTPVANRERVELRELIGFFVNTLPLRISVTAGQTFIDLLEHVKQSTLAGLSHKDIPFELIVDAVQPERSLGHSPLFQVLFVMHNTPSKTQDFGELSISPFETLNKSAKFDLTLAFEEVAGEFYGTCIYDSDLFKVPTIESFVSHFQTLLESSLSTPRNNLIQLPLMTEQEKTQVVSEWNNTYRDFSLDTEGRQDCLHHCFLHQVLNTPNAIAVVTDDGEWTYQTVFLKAITLAQWLQKNGVGPDVLVGVCAERSYEMVVALYGILFAGGAYVPLDPDYPKDRLQYMLNDSSVSIVLASNRVIAAKVVALSDSVAAVEANSSDISGHTDKVTVLDLTDDWNQIESIALESNTIEVLAQSVKQKILNEPLITTADHLAYMIYTSGSTGRPKGVLVSHRAIVNRILWMQDEFPIDETDAVLQKTPFSFDVSVWEFFWPLMQGAQLIVAAPGAHKDPKALEVLINRYKITTLHFVPSMLNLFLAAMPKGACNSLRQVFCSGEALSCDTQERFFSLITCGLYNLYGPTEAAVDVTYWRCDSNHNRRSVPIGRPIANTQMYILDPAGHPVPPGVAGELMIAGVGLARGYHNKPDLTRSKFIDNPFNSQSKLYKTGDLARYNIEGIIEFLGRIDNQVKIRGFRIELDEIEQVARSYSGLKDVVVIAKQRTEEDKVLMAWVVFDVEADIKGLNDYWESQLPHYMVPSYITAIKSIPLTANGKVDLKSLPELTVTNDPQLTFVAPRNRMERFICQQWLEAISADALVMAELGIDDDLFHVGGHSLTAVRLVTRISDQFGLQIPLQSVFKQSTPRKLSNWIARHIMQLKGGGSISLSAIDFSSYEKSGLWPLSFAQERLWFLEQMQSGTTLYNISTTLQLDGLLDEIALEHSLQTMVDRHDILRTLFIAHDGIPYQKTAVSAIATIDKLTLNEESFTDASITSASLLEDKIAALTRQDQETPFDIETGPLYRFRLLQTDNNQHIIFVSFHHLISDGWSLDVFIKEFSACYAAYVRAEQITLNKLPLSYSQYSLWHRQKIESGTQQQSIAYWKQTLADAPPLLELPWDYTRPSQQTTRGSSIPFALDAGLLAKLKRIGKQGNQKQSSTTDASVFVLLLAGLNILLSRYSQQNDVVIGTAVANRDYSQTESMLGLFVNSLAIRTTIDNELSFIEFLHQVEDNFLSAFEHRELPFEKVVELLNVERNLSYTPVFQAMLVLQNASDGEVSLSGIDVTALPVQSRSSKFDLSFILQETLNTESVDELNGIIEFNTDLFDVDSVKGIMASYLNLLEAICDAPEKPIASYCLVPAQAKQKLMEWRGVETVYPRLSTVHDYFSDIVTRYPSNVAIREVGVGLSSKDLTLAEPAVRELTYHQLDQQADQVAHYLLNNGISKGQCVGICVERSSFLIVAILGVLKAGAVFVPLDPSYPKERLQFIVDDTQSKVVINSRLTLKQLDLDESVTALVIDESEWIQTLVENNSNIRTNKSLDIKWNDAAYIMYTSGSTGVPKGVVTSHQAILRLVVNSNYFSVSDSDNFLQYAPISFDASTFEIWGALLNGACLVVAPAGNLPLHQLGQLVRQQQISTLWLTSNLFNAMVDDFPHDLLTVKQLLTGGEAISTQHLRRALDALPETKLINGYGPTENTTFTCAYQIPVDHDDDRPVPIGKPIANTTVFILETNLNFVPIGMPGELYTGGDGLSSGYWQRAELTEDNFLDNPYEMGKLYKTGDRARWLANGTIEYLGRVDDQLKIRGFRIEPREIETILNSLRLNDTRLVGQCAVAARELAHGGKVLVAWVCLPAGLDRASVDEGLLTSLLEQQLPAFMVPSHILILAEFPLTSSGKLDRNVLPFDANALQTDDGDKPYVEPVTTLEKTVAGIWQDLLRIDDIGLTGSFFELGGHSLLATQLVSRVRTVLQIDVSINTIFESPLLGQYCLRLVQIDSARPNSEQKLSGSSLSITQCPDNVKKVLSFAQERLWFLDQLEPGNPFYNISVALELTGLLDRVGLQCSLDRMIERHEILRTSFSVASSPIDASDAGVPQQNIHPAYPCPMVFDVLSDMDQQQQQVMCGIAAKDEAQKPFDLVKLPLIRTRLLQLSEDKHTLIVTMHHIIADGWSMGIVIRELSAFYQFSLQSIENTDGLIFSAEDHSLVTASGDELLSALPIQYLDYAAWQKSSVMQSTLNDQLVYWCEQLAGANTVLDLAFDRPRGAQQSFKGSSVRFEIDASVVEKLRETSSTQGCTLYMTLLSAWAILLYRHTGEEDILVGSPIANRNHQDIEGLIGFFVNTLAMRFDFKGNPTFASFLMQVRKTALDAFANQDLPFEKLVDSIQPERDLSRNPLFQVMFALQNAPAEEFGLSGLSIEVIETQRISALFDLVLDMWETENSLIGVLEFATDLWDQTTVEHMVGQFIELLSSIAQQPTMQVKSLSILPPAERETLLHDWIGKTVSYPVDRTLQDLFQSQTLSYPDRIAASHGEENITYAELNNRAARFAEVLRLSGVVQNDIVGIYHYRGISFLVAVMGVLKSGASFVPIDPTYPMARVRHMLADSEVRVLISSNTLLETLYDKLADDDDTQKPSGELNTVLTLDSVPPTLEVDVLAQFNLWTYANIEAIGSGYHNEGCSTDRAYMMYTSGSTGTPKGALIRHNGAVNHIFAQFDELNFHQNSIFAQSAPCSSDISIWQFLAPLMIGGSTRIIDFETVCVASALFDEVKRATIFEFVPIVLNELLEFVSGLTEEQRALPNIDYAMVTGESVSVNLVNRWHQLYPKIALCNAYGPTEAADDICQFTIDKPMPENCLRVPIGTAIANTAIYVLDKELQLVPIGVPGEICVAGIGVGEGYWKQAEKTAASFLENPYSVGEYDKILYRTGDLGRWQATGNLEYFHRADNQVKLRGYRIELDEIEGVLFKHASVQEVVVGLSHETEGDQAQDQRLLAWVVVSAQNEQEEQLLQQERVNLWQSLHEDSYQGDSLHKDVTFNTIGWDSTYTGEPLSDAEMHEYIDLTLDIVFADNITEIETKSAAILKPRVLEIGCGTGLLMYNLINRCASYVGTDLSDVVINRLAYQVNPVNGLQGADTEGKTTLYCREAINFSGFEAASFDRLMLCSVVQYFPSLGYLTQTLEQAVRVVSDGGKIVVGDVRNYALLKAYHTSIELFQAADESEISALETGVAERSLREQELTIDPSWFLLLPELIPAISFVELLPKRGKLQNEMTCFRYDVVLHINSQATSVDVTWQEWSQEKPTVDAIKQQLAQSTRNSVGWKAIRNRRVVDETQLIAWLESGQCATDVSTIRANLKNNPLLSIEPEDLIDIARLSGWRVHFRMAEGNFSGDYDVVFFKPKLGLIEFPNYPLVEQKRTREYSNNPLKEKLAAFVTPQLRTYLQDQLPAHMIPADFVMLENLPLLPNGKIDRSSLPAPLRSRASATKPYIAPSTELEHIIANIWSDVLGLEAVGVDDNFFELGGHSLKAVQVISRFQRDTSKQMSLRDLFSLPTVSLLAAECADRDSFDYQRIPTIEDADYYSVSHGQRRLWVIAQMDDSGNGAYNMPASLLLRGPADHDLLNSNSMQQALSCLIENHEILRTTFTEKDGELVQLVNSAKSYRSSHELIRLVDLSASDDPMAQARDFVEQDTATSFDLEYGPLFRMSLLKIDSQTHVLVFNIHHIICDGWSMSQIIREFSSALLVSTELNAASSRVEVAHRGLQYRDYAAWQAKLLKGAEGERHREYWHQKLAGQWPVLDVLSDYRRPVRKTYHGDSQRIVIDKNNTDRLQALCDSQKSSLYSALVSVVKLLLFRYTQQTDLIVGCPIAGRPHIDLEDQLGFYVNTLVLRDKIDVQASFRYFLTQVTQTVNEAHEHQIYPFDSLVDELNIERDISRSPITEVMVLLQNLEEPQIDFGSSIQARPFIEDSAVSKFDLQFTFESKAMGLSLDLVYNTDIYSNEKISRILSHFELLLIAILDNPGNALSSFAILSDSERDQLLSFNNLNIMPQQQASTQTLADRFEQQVVKSPDAIAITIPGVDIQQFSYAELNSKADVLASHLQLELGVQSGELVAVLLDLGFNAVTAFLAIAKLGAAYVPLDPGYPDDRIEWILQDSGCRTLVSIAPYFSELKTEIAVIDINQLPRNSLTDDFIIDKARARCDTHPAYVIYTSGSTGLPKGCLVSQRNVVALLDQAKHHFDFRSDDVWIQAHSNSFDFSVWEMYGALLNGAELIVPSVGEVRNAQAFRQILENHRVTILNQTPAAFYNLVEIEKDCLSHKLSDHLRMVIFGGDQLLTPSLRPWCHWYDPESVALVNMYGITETTVHVTYHRLSREEIEGTSGRCLVGVPLPRVEVYVLDSTYELSPIGIPGEIYVGGSGVSIGYLNRQDLNRDRFIKHPFTAGERLYRSGDLGRWRSDGLLEHLGRNDDQVQFNGFRIELGEIEAVLSKHADIERAVVLMHLSTRDGVESESLIAYLLASKPVDRIEQGNHSLNPKTDNQNPLDTISFATTDLTKALRAHLESLLPVYMVPSLYIMLQKIPLTTNGKVDRKALPDPSIIRLQEPSNNSLAKPLENAIPRNALEAQLTEVWSQILSVDKPNNEKITPSLGAIKTIDINQNFFELGGDSLGVIRLSKAIKEKMNCELEVVDLFQYTTIASQAVFISQQSSVISQQMLDVNVKVKRQKDARAKRRNRRVQ